MDSLLHYGGIAILLLGCVLALISLVIGLPGTFLMVALALAYGLGTGFRDVGWSTIGWLALLAIVGEGVEFAASAIGTSAGGRPSRRASIWAIAGALAGGIFGTPILLGLGSLLGALVGAFAGAALAVGSEGASAGEALAAGIAAMKGRLLGFVVKAAIAVAMIVIVAAAVF